MNQTDILTHLPSLYFIKGEKNKYEVLKELGLSGRGRDYDKIKELIDMGFLENVSDNPPTFIVTKDCQKKIWNFMKNTPIGEKYLELVRDNTALFE